MTSHLGSESAVNLYCQTVGFETILHVHLSYYITTDTPAQLQNRTINAPLLRYVDSMRTHGHRAAHIDPLDLLQRDEVAALNPVRYNLLDASKKYSVDGIIWTNPSGPNTSTSESWTLEQIVKHLRSVYVVCLNAYCRDSSYTDMTRVTLPMNLCIHLRKQSACGFHTFWNL